MCFFPQAIPEADIPSPLTYEAPINAKTRLSVIIGLNRRIFIKNGSEQEQLVPAGTIIAGWYKGKFWLYKRDSAGQAPAKKSKKSSGEEITEMTDADVLFTLQDAESVVAVNGKPLTLSQLFAERRKTHPEAGVQYHKLHDKPLPDKPGFFTLELEVHICFRGEDVPSKAEGDGVAKVAMHHLAGCLKASDWDTPSSHVIWAVKWSATAGKGLTPVRPMVMTKVPLRVPAKSAVELTAAAKADENAGIDS